MNSVETDKAPTLTDRIAGFLRQQIVSGQYDPDDRLPGESEIAAQFNTSLPTVRGALRDLLADGLIYGKRGPNGGHFVNRPSLHAANRLVSGMTTWLVRSGNISATDILETRRSLGNAFVAMAAQRRTENDLIRFELALRKMSDSSLPNQIFCASEIQFSRALAAASGNRLIMLLNLITTGAYATAARLKVFTFHERETLVDFGHQLVSAIRSRHHERAVSVNNEMQDSLRDFLFSSDLPARGHHQASQEVNLK